MKYTYRTGIKKIKTKVLNVSVSLIVVAAGLGAGLPALVTSVAHADAPTPIEINSVSDLRNAIEHQDAGQIWNIHNNGTSYGLAAFNDITVEGQTGWYFPITASNLTINGVGNPTIYGTGYTANGAWHTQDFVAIFGDNVTLNGLTLMPKVEPNKTVEVLGADTTISNVTIAPNTLTNPSEYSSVSDPTDPSWAEASKHWGGSIYYNNATGTQTLTNMSLENSGISVHAPGATFNVSNVNFSYTSDVDWVNDYRFYVASSTSVVNGAPTYTYHVNSALNNFDSVLAAVGDSTTVAGSETIELDSDITTSKQITLTKAVTLNGNDHTVSSTFTKTDNDNNSALGIQASNITINNLVVDGAASTNLHGINVVGSNNVALQDVTVNNNDHTGINVNASKVTVTNITTNGNGWHGIDVDKTGAVLTINGVSHHSDALQVYVDDINVGQVIDTNHQYGHKDNVLVTGDRAYYLKPATPTQLSPADNGYVATNDFYFDWSDVSGVAEYEFQSSQNPATTDGVLTTGVWNNKANGGADQNHLTASEIHSYGASGTWYWQVRAIDANGITSDWSPVWKMTIDTSAPAAPTNLSWKTSTNVTVPNDGFTNVAGGTASWQASSSGDVDHYVYKYWNDIVGNPYKVGHEYTVNVSDTSLPGTFNQGEGVHHFCVEAVDHAGNTSACTEFTITYDTTAPVAAITAPHDGDTVHDTVTVSGTVTDTNPDRYYFVVKDSHGTVKAGPGTVNAATVSSWNWNTKNAPDGVYTIDLEARDAAGNKTSVSVATIHVTVDNTAPTATIDAYNGTDTTPTLTGTVSDPTASLTVKIDNSTPAAAHNNGDGTWSFTVPTALSAGTHTIVLTATDTAGNSYPTTANVTVVAAPASPTGIQNSQGNGNSDQAPGHLPTVTVTPNNDGQVLGDSTTTTGEVKGDSTVNPATVHFANDTALRKGDTKNASASFLGLGWWWLAVLAALLGFFLFVFRRPSNNS